MNTEQTWQAITEQRLAIAELLAGLPAADWERPSLCAGWRIRDVAAHLTIIPMAPSAASMVIDLARAGGNPHRMNTLSTRRRAARTPEQLVDDLRSSAPAREIVFASKVFAGSTRAAQANVLMDVLVHAQDIAAPLGLDLATNPVAGAAAADRIWEMGWPFEAKRRLSSLKLTATDADWTIGTGPEVTGPIKAILLLLTGRTEAARPMLTGDGVRHLTAV